MAAPIPKGRLLKEGKFNAIGFMPPGAYAMAEMIRSPYGRELVLGAALACDAAGATLSLVNGTDDTRMASIREALVDGFILGHCGRHRPRDLGTKATAALRHPGERRGT